MDWATWCAWGGQGIGPIEETDPKLRSVMLCFLCSVWTGYFMVECFVITGLTLGSRGARNDKLSP
jgi:hypothetical protein